MPEYKVLDVNAAILESKINAFATSGWRVVSVVQMPGTNRLCVVLEK